MRRWLVPEVIQTFAMDCGPAALTALLRGYGLPVSFEALAARCQTGLDGTSIDDLEEVARSLGLQVEQIAVPIDYALDSRTGCLPAIAVTADPSGALHFIVLWSWVGPLLQIMDPRRGRYLAWPSAIRDRLFLHEIEVDRGDFVTFTKTSSFRWFLAHRARSVGLDTLRDVDPADVDAALRFASELSGVSDRRTTAAIIRALLAKPDLIPEAMRFARTTEENQVLLRGAILLKAIRRDQRPPAPQRTTSERELLAGETPLWRGLLPWLREPWLIMLVSLSVALSAAMTLLEAVLWRGALDLLHLLGSPAERLLAVLSFGLFSLCAALLSLPTSALVQQIGRSLEIRLRLAFSAKIPKLSRAYLTSRPVSDWAERGHALHAVRALPSLLRSASGHVSRIVLLVFGIGALSPLLFPIAMLVAAVSIAIPAALHRLQLARQMRSSTQAGALARFTLDAMLGAIPIRTHGAQRAVRSEHEALLTDWARSTQSAHDAVAISASLQVLLGLTLSGLLLAAHAAFGSTTAGTTLLLVHWSLLLPTYGELLAGTLSQLPHPLSVLARMLGPLAAPEEQIPEPSPLESMPDEPVSIAFEGLSVRLGGREVLSGVDLAIQPGEHVAIVGASGTGKSTLVSALLGLVPASGGRILVDGRPLQGAALADLRRCTAHSEPGVWLWNRSLLHNVRYGVDPGAGRPVGECIAEADLDALVGRMPEGLQTALGEGGSRLSGGEGNRVRLARALGRPKVRLVLLDEAFRGLDRWSRAALLARTRARFQGVTLLCVTHDIAETETFPRVVAMEGGRAVEDGSPADLREQGGLYRRLLDKEAEIASSWWSYSGWRRWWIERGELREERPEVTT